LEDGDRTFLEVEEDDLGVNHVEIGGAVTAILHFPPDIQFTVAGHHRPDLQPESDNPIPWIAHPADQACLIMSIGRGTDGLNYYGLAYVSDRFGLTQKALESLMVDFLAEFRRVSIPARGSAAAPWPRTHLRLPTKVYYIYG